MKRQKGSVSEAQGGGPLSHKGDDLEKAVEALRGGGIVAYPTETFYGLAVDPANEQALQALYTLKVRGRHKPLSLLIPERRHLFSIASSCPDAYGALMDAFWPGPLTLIFSAQRQILSALTAAGSTVAMRVSSHPLAQELCRCWGGALTATSANVSGMAPLVQASAVRELWGDRLSYILDGGETPGGLGSTIIQCFEQEKRCRVIREGVILTREIIHKLPPYYIVCKS